MSRNFAAGVSKQIYAETRDILDEEFAALKRTVAAINVATNMVQTLINDTAGGTPGMDHTTFFVTDVAHVAPAVDPRFPILQ